MIEGNLVSLQFQFSYVNELPIDSIQHAEGDGSHQDQIGQLDQRLMAPCFPLLGMQRWRRAAQVPSQVVICGLTKSTEFKELRQQPPRNWSRVGVEK